MRLLTRFGALPALLAAVAASLLVSGCFEALVVGGATGAAVVASDRREPEVVLGDERVELTASTRLSKAFGDRAHIDVTSYNYTVLLTGEVPDKKAKQEAEQIVSQIERVQSVVNELQIAGVSSLASRANDTYLTGRVKAAFVAAQKFSPNHVKVITEAGVVYLMGLVTHREADDATEIARTISGVRKVVRVFEYILAPGAHSESK